MGRRWVLISGWALSTVAATLIAWTAVRQVTAEVAPAPVLPLPSAVALVDVATEAATAPTTRPSTRAAPDRPATDPPEPREQDEDEPAEQTDQGAQRDPGTRGSDGGEDIEQDPQPDPGDTATITHAYDLVGGVVTVRYSGNTTNLVEASPRSGFVVEVDDGGPGKVDVRFRSDGHESRFTTRVRNGEPDPERDERSR